MPHDRLPHFPSDSCDTIYLLGYRNKKALLIPRKLSPQLTVPANIGKPPYADSGVFPPWAENPQFHDAEVRSCGGYEFTDEAFA